LGGFAASLLTAGRHQRREPQALSQPVGFNLHFGGLGDFMFLRLAGKDKEQQADFQLAGA
jgi:hypothetical protein